jgi:hypothetical protein
MVPVFFRWRHKIVKRRHEVEYFKEVAVKQMWEGGIKSITNSRRKENPT